MVHATSIVELREHQGSNRDAPCVLVPTMGALHDGHASLIRQGATLARERGWGGGCIVSIFVNPTQFNDPADFERYPRTIDADLRLCQEAGANCVWTPHITHIYPLGRTIEAPLLPRVAQAPGLEDAHRPGHFEGVCQVVARLFDLVKPTAAIFGEKDWQQLQVIRAMTAMLMPGLEIVAGPTLREPDGLAMSSRNRFLTAEDRRRARAISLALCESNAALDIDQAQANMRRVLATEQIEPEYAVVRSEGALEPGAGPWRALIAARVGSVRLIDNSPWRPSIQPRA